MPVNCNPEPLTRAVLLYLTTTVPLLYHDCTNTVYGLLRTIHLSRYLSCSVLFCTYNTVLEYHPLQQYNPVCGDRGLFSHPLSASLFRLSAMPWAGLSHSRVGHGYDGYPFHFSSTCCDIGSHSPDTLSRWHRETLIINNSITSCLTLSTVRAVCSKWCFDILVLLLLLQSPIQL
jgi:hypothetical protein